MRLMCTIRSTLLAHAAAIVLLAVASSAGAQPICDHRNEFEQDVAEKRIGCRSIISTTGTVQEDALYTDAPAVGVDGRITIERRYSNYRAYYDAWRQVNPAQEIAFDSWGSGWLHDLERSIVVDVTTGIIFYVRPDGENTQTFQPLPSLGCTPFDILLNTWFGGDYYSAVKMQIVGSCAATMLDEFELWIQETDGAVWKFAWSSGGIYLPYEVVQPSGYTLSFHYFDAGSTVPDCTAPASFEDGRLCQIRGSDSATVRFAYYDPDEVGFEGRGGLQSIEAGPTPTAMATRALYTYAPETREVADCTLSTIALCENLNAWTLRPAQDPSRTVWLLTGVTHQRQGASGWETHSTEAYEYTSESYYNPTASGQLFGYDTRHPIRAPFVDESLPCTVSGACAHQRGELWLVRRIRRGTSAGDALVRGHEYTACGLGATDEKTGGYEWVGYEFDIAPAFECDHKGFATVSYFNESSGEQRSYRVDWDEAALMEVSDECACSAAAMTFERSSLQVFAKSDAAGVRTTYAYDTDRRPVLEQVNWDGDTETPSTSPFPDPPDNSGKPVRSARFEYAPNVTAEHTVESRVFSAACETRNPEFASYSCAGYSVPLASSDEPMLEIDYDPDTAGGYNDTGTATRRSRQRMTGWTSADASSEVLVRQERETRFEYAGPRLTAIVDPLGYRAERTYHAAGPDAGRLSTAIWNDGRQPVVLARYSDYDAEGRPGKIIDENDAYQVIDYDLDGRIEQYTSFDADDQPVRQTIMRYNDSETPRLVAVGPPGGPYVATLNAEQLPAVGDVCNQQDSADEAQFVTGLSKCLATLAGLERDATVSRGIADGSLVFTAHSATNLSYANPGGVSRFDTYDVLGARFQLRDVEYDAAGREKRQWRYTSSDAAPSGVRDFDYDERGLQTRVVDPRYADVTLPASTNLVNANRIFTYNAFEELATETVGAGTPGESTVAYEYDAHGNLSRIVDGAGRATAYLYDDFGAVIAVESPDTGRTTFAYNLAGQTTERRHADGQVVSFAYDTRYRLLTETYPGSPPRTLTYRYDTLLEARADANCPGIGTVSFDPDAQYMGGRLAAVVHEAGATYYSYDSLGQVTAVYEQPGPVFSVCDLEITRYSYDAAGRLASVRYPSGRLVGYEYENASAKPTLYPASLSVDGAPLLSAIDFNPLGVPASYAASALTFSGAWNLSGEPATRLYETPVGDDLFHWDVGTRDGNGNILLAREHVLNQRQDFVYDGQDRVSTSDSMTTGTETVPRGKQSCVFDYDSDGNRIDEQCHGQTVVDYTYEGNSSRLDTMIWQANLAVCTEGGTVVRPIVRDDRGRATFVYRDAFRENPDEYTLFYGALGRLGGVDTDGDLQPDFEYAYDHHGMRREKREVAAGTHAFIYDLQQRLLSEKLHTGQRREYIYLGDEIVAVADGAGTVLVGSDHLMAARRGWNAATGALSWALDYEAFGSATAYGPSPASALPTRFPGQYYDEETGLHYNGRRYYHPATGRYISADPIGQRGGINIYAYAENRPTTMTDPSGLEAGIPPGFEFAGRAVVENYQLVENTVPNHVWEMQGPNVIIKVESETIVKDGKLVSDRIVTEYFVIFLCV